MSVHSIAGEWSGSYQYEGVSEPAGEFTAFFSEDSGRLGGTIVDASSAGKAWLTGSFAFPSIRFTKIYMQPSQTETTEKHKQTVPKFKLSLGIFAIAVNKEHEVATTRIETYGDPVEYEGTISADGQILSGSWSIKSKEGVSKGTWSAQRKII